MNLFFIRWMPFCIGTGDMVKTDLFNISLCFRWMQNRV